MKQKNQGFISIVVALVVGAIVAGGALAFLRKEAVIQQEPQPEVQPENTELLEELQKQRDELLKVKEELEAQLREFGATVNPVAGAVYYLSGSGLSGSATSFTLTSLTIPQTGYELLDADFSDTFYVTFEPGSRTRQEIVSCTTVAQSGSDNTATVSGCTRGLLPFTPFTASTTYQFAHGGGTSVIFSNPPQLYEQFPARADNENITGAWNFDDAAIIQYDANPTFSSDTDIITKKYADDLAIAGVSDGNYTTFGGFILATSSDLANGVATSTATRYLVAPSQAFGSTSAARVMIPVTDSSGDISSHFIPTNILHDLTIFNSNLEIQASSLVDAHLTFTDDTGSLGRISSMEDENEVRFLGSDTNSVLRETFSISQGASTTVWEASVPLYYQGSLAAITYTSTTGTSTWQAATGTETVIIRMVGAGGSGGSGGSDVGGGGGGGYCETWVDIANNATGTITVGAAGAVTSTGQASTVLINGTTYSANGGSFGSGATGGSGGSGSSCNLIISGAPGQTVDTTDAWLGYGGTSAMGGVAGRGGNGNSAGSNGIVIIYEYR